MTEELYIIKDGVREKCDLSTPSGITLSYESNLFNSLDKVNCSRSYTFKLPKTGRNTRIFGAADDVRSMSAAVGFKMKAQFIVNGIDICPNATLYLSSANGDEFAAVMSWDNVEGLEYLKANDININELETEEEKIATSGDMIVKADSRKIMTNYYKEPDWLYYYCGNGSEFFRPMGQDAYNLPVLSTSLILERINNWFGTKIFINDRGGIADCTLKNYEPEISAEGIQWIDVRVIQDGCIPVVDSLMRNEQLQRLNVKFATLSVNSRDGYFNFGYVENNSRGEIITQENYFKPKTYEILSYFCLQNVTYNLEINLTAISYSGNEPIYLEIVKTDFFGREEVIMQLESEYNNGLFSLSGQTYTHIWKFGGNLGAKKSISFEIGEDVSAVRFRFVNNKDNGKVAKNVTFANDCYINIVPKFDFGAELPIMDAIYSLPEISCLTFLKSLFYIMGAFPKVGKNGNIYPCSYQDIYDNAISGNVYDWSNNLINPKDNPKEITWKVGDFAQHNYYCMKSDKLGEPDSDSEDADKYTKSVLDITVNNSLLQKEKTIVQLPFNAPFEKYGDNPKEYTGYTFKYWSMTEDGKKTAQKAEPIYGIRLPYSQVFWNNLSCWHFLRSARAYSVLRKMLQNPKVMKCELRIDEYTLSTLDYTKPVYLYPYASYFVIMKIQRNSDGICIAELLKLNLD